MKKISTYLLLLIGGAALTTFTNCGDNSELETEPLEGIIAGEAWTFKYAKAIYNEIDNLYDAELYGTQQTNDDPCSIFISGESHLSIQIPNATGNFQVPADMQVIFQLPGGGNDLYRATSGFVEVTSSAGGQLVGYIQASYDDDNSVEGTFSFRRCN